MNGNKIYGSEKRPNWAGITRRKWNNVYCDVVLQKNSIWITWIEEYAIWCDMLIEYANWFPLQESLSNIFREKYLSMGRRVYRKLQESSVPNRLAWLSVSEVPSSL